MQLRFLPTSLKSALVFLLASLGPLVNAQPAGQLYDPEPPADSAYVRVIVASRGAVVDVMEDGHPRIVKLKSGEPSDYMVLSAGKHSIAIHAAGKSTAQVSTTLDIVRGRAMTLAFTTLLSDAEPIVFEDKTNSNKLKSMLAVYNLDSKSGPLDLLTADGNTKVFVGVAHGAPASIQVNPISVELIAAKTGDKTPLTRISIAMTQGGTYSVFLLPTEGGKLSALAARNKTERYTAK